jgi:predicted alpha/beta hydrolase family esterase
MMPDRRDNTAPVVILPGLYNSGHDHWQSRSEAAGFALLQELRRSTATS